MVFLTIFFSILFSIYIFIDNIKNKEIVNNNTYYLLNKNTTKKQILYELKSRKIDISLFDWVISSFFHKSIFIPKAGEYLIPKNLTVFEIQKLFQYGKTITRHFTLVEGSTASQLKSNLISNPFLTGDIGILKEGIYKPDTYFFKYGYSRKK